MTRMPYSVTVLLLLSTAARAHHYVQHQSEGIDANKCKNGAKYTNIPRPFTCTCDEGWTGSLCHEDINECDRNPCKNGGVCTNNEGSFTCTCDAGWTGAVCEQDINECVGTNVCKTLSNCVNTPGSYTCICYKCLSEEKCILGSRGKKFIVLFMKLGSSPKSVYITSENGVQMNITTSPLLDSSLKAQIDKNIIIPSSQHITFPKELELISFQKEVKSVLIETSDDVSVITHNVHIDNIGGTTNLPLHRLSTKYVVISFEPYFSGFYTLFAVVAIEDDTNVSVIFKMKQNKTLNIDGKTFYDGDVFHFRLARFETYQIEHITDLTGTFIESSAPIAAFSGNDFNSFGRNANNLIEQLPPYDSVDKKYIVPPHLPDRGTLIRITATENAYVSYAIGDVSQIRSLNKFESFDTKISSSQTCFVESKTPILVTSFGLDAKRHLIAAPSMTIVPGFNQYLDYYKIVVPPGYTENYLSIMIKKSSKDLVHINGTFIKANDIVFEKNVSDGNVIYNVRSIRVVEGELTASTVNSEPFGLMFDGAKKYSAFGFSGNSVFP